MALSLYGVNCNSQTGKNLCFGHQRFLFDDVDLQRSSSASDWPLLEFEFSRASINQSETAQRFLSPKFSCQTSDGSQAKK